MTRPPRLAVLRRRAPRARGDARRRRAAAGRARPTAPLSTRAAARSSVRWRTPASCVTASRPAHGGALAALDSRALCVIRETLALPRRPRRFRVRDAGAGLRRDHARGNGGAAGAMAAARRAGRRDRGVRALRAGRRLRRRRDVDARAPRRRRLASWTAARRGSRTAASPTSTACSRAPARRPARAASRRSSCPRTRRD